MRSSGFIILALLALGSGCGPAPSNQLSRNGATAGVSDPAVTRTETGISQTDETANSAQTPTVQNTLNDPIEPLVVPEWIAKDLMSSDIHVKLQALDRWAQTAPIGSVDPLLLALDDEDKTVQATALSLLEQDWRRTQEDEQ